MDWQKDINVIVLKGLVLKSLEVNKYNNVMSLTTEDDKQFIFLHHQDCCESVSIYDTKGDVESIIDSPILNIEEIIDCQNWPEDVPVPEYRDSYTWTTYIITTKKGSYTIRWLGESNGYYSESVSFQIVS